MADPDILAQYADLLDAPQAPPPPENDILSQYADIVDSPAPVAPPPKPKAKGPTRETHPELYGDVKPRYKKSESFDLGYVKTVPFLDRVIAVAATVKDKLDSDVKDDKSYSQHLSGVRKDIDEAYNANPKHFAAGSAVGYGSMTAATTVAAPSTLAGHVAQGAGIGAAESVHSSRADIFSGKAAWAATKGALIGGAVSGGVGAVLGVGGNVAKQVKVDAAKMASEQTTKDLARYGYHGTPLSNLRAERGDEALEKAFTWARQKLSDPTTATTVQRQAQATLLKEEASKAMQHLLRSMDESIAPWGGVPIPKLKWAANQTIRKSNGANSKIQAARQLKREIATAAKEKTGISFDTLYAHRQKAQDTVFSATDNTAKKATAREYVKLVDGVMEEMFDAIAPGAKEAFKEAQEEFSMAILAEDALKATVKEQTRAAAKPFIQSFDRMVGKAGAVAGRYVTAAVGDAGRAAKRAILGTSRVASKVPHKVKYGALHEGVDSLVHPDPNAHMNNFISRSGRYQETLTRAAARGRSTLNSTIYILAQQDPEFRAEYEAFIKEQQDSQ